MTRSNGRVISGPRSQTILSGEKVLGDWDRTVGYVGSTGVNIHTRHSYFLTEWEWRCRGQIVSPSSQDRYWVSGKYTSGPPDSRGSVPIF